MEQVCTLEGNDLLHIDFFTCSISCVGPVRILITTYATPLLYSICSNLLAHVGAIDCILISSRAVLPVYGTKANTNYYICYTPTVFHMQ